MSAFNYLAKPNLLANLELGLSPERFQRYVGLAGGNNEKGMQLYAWNTALSEAVYGPLQALEILTRNKIHNRLVASFRVPAWYDQPGVLQYPQQQKLQHGKQKLTQAGRPHLPASIVAELTFGFWTGLLGVSYDQTLWRKQKLYQLFQGRIGRNSRKDVHRDYDELRKLRNRIAHHECVLDPHLPAKHALIIDLTRVMCADTAAWAAHHSRFQAAWSDPVNPWLAPVIAVPIVVPAAAPPPAAPAAPAPAAPAAGSSPS